MKEQTMVIDGSPLPTEPSPHPYASRKTTALVVVAMVLLGAGVFLARVPVSADSRAVSCPQFISHAAAKQITPENTVVGLNAAHTVYGSTVTEIDIRFNKSHFAIGMHNDDIAITTTGSGSITTKWLPDVQAVSAADYGPWPTSVYGGYNPDSTPKVRPPYTYEILDSARDTGMTLVLDVKVTPTAADATSFISYIDRAEFAGIKDNLIWMANTPDGLVAMRNHVPDLTYWLINQPANGTMWTGEYLHSIGAVGVTYHIDRITPELVQYYHSFNPPIQVNTWTTNNASQDTALYWQKAIDAGVDYLTTDLLPQARSYCLGQASPSPSPFQ